MSGADDFPKGPLQFAPVTVFALFRCECGCLAAMGDQDDGNAAMMHESPHCERFEAVRTIDEGQAYYRSLAQLPMLSELLLQLKRNQQHC